MLLASFGALAQGTADAQSWGTASAAEAPATLRCLPDRTAWRTEPCAALAEAEARREGAVPVELALRVRERALHREAALSEEAARTARAARRFARAEAHAREAALKRAQIADIHGEHGRTASPVDRFPFDWGVRLFGQALAPLLVSGLVAAVPGAVLVATLAAVLIATLLAPLLRRGEGGPRRAARVEGTVLARGLALLGSRVMAAVGLATIVTAAAWTVCVWAFDADFPTRSAGAFAGAGVLVAALLVTARVLGVSPARAFGTTSGPLETLRIALDIPYDIATYLRVGQPGATAPRERMLARYRSLLAHVAEGGRARRPYDALVIAAHSQGSVLSAAVLFGDRCRHPAADPLDADARRALPPRMSLLTAGSPLRQIYDARLPGQYEWVAAPWRFAPVREARLDTWVNVYRTGDYVGRALWQAPPPIDPASPVWQHPAGEPEGAPALRERCLGEGTHTGYWSDPDWLEELMRLVSAGDPAGPAGSPASLQGRRRNGG